MTWSRGTGDAASCQAGCRGVVVEVTPHRCQETAVDPVCHLQVEHGRHQRLTRLAILRQVSA